MYNSKRKENKYCGKKNVYQKTNCRRRLLVGRHVGSYVLKYHVREQDLIRCKRGQGAPLLKALKPQKVEKSANESIYIRKT